MMEQGKQLRQHAARVFSMGFNASQELAMRSCWEVWKEARQERVSRLQRERQAAVTGKALMGMLANQEGMLIQGVWMGWRDEMVRARQAREQQARDLEFAAEVRRHKERHAAMVLGCMAKWGSESNAVLTATSFRGWRDLMEHGKQLRQHATT